MYDDIYTCDIDDSIEHLRETIEDARPGSDRADLLDKLEDLLNLQSQCGYALRREDYEGGVRLIPEWRFEDELREELCVHQGWNHDEFPARYIDWTEVSEDYKNDEYFEVTFNGTSYYGKEQ